MVDDENGGIERLRQAIAKDFAILNLPPKNWVNARQGPNGKPMTDVLVVGGGMCGVTAAFHLRRLGIRNIRVIDGQPAGREGPWRTFARMATLRSPKHLTGPASGLPNLTFRAWYEAKNEERGRGAWEKLGYIPREMWADYLDWFAGVTSAKVHNNVRLKKLKPIEGAAAGPEQGLGWRADLHSDAAGNETVYARVVVLATGREGLAVPRIPAEFAPFHGDGVDHTGDAPCRSKMRGRDVAVIGLGASAFDYAAEALEGGARHVRILGRSSALARINKAKQIVYAGFVHGYPLLPDAEKADILEHIFERGIAPPRGTVQRVMKHANVELILGAPVEALTRTATGGFALATPNATYNADRIVLGTGYRVDLAAAPYLAADALHIKRWRDVLPERETARELLDFPYLGQGFQFAPRDAADHPHLSRLLCFNHAAMLSLGNLANDIPAVSEGADRLAQHVAALLFLEDRAQHRRDLANFQEPELFGDEVPKLQQWWPQL